MPALSQLILLPIILPLLTASLLLIIDIRHRGVKFAISFTASFVQFIVAAILYYLCITQYWPQGIGHYLTANWPVPFSIVLLIDPLAALMLLLSSLLALAVLIFSWTRWSRAGIHFYALCQFLFMGINGIFLTGDLFNLFVFFEVMLAASYGLILNTYNSTRIRAGLQYLAINLVGSSFFLIGIALIYAATGSLNMADIAYKIPLLTDDYRLLLHIGAGMLAVAFLTKSGIWPLGFWLPNTYSASSAPVAALLALMTKIGIFVILRLWGLFFSEYAGASALFGSSLLLYAGFITIAYGAVGLLASQEPMRMASFSAIISSGILLSCLSYGQTGLNSATLYYLLSSTLALTALILLIELIERIRTPSANLLAITMEAFAIEDSSPAEDTVGVSIPASMALIAIAFVASALIIAGLPPLSGFIAKFSIFHALLNHDIELQKAFSNLFFMGLILASGLAAIIALMRFGVRTFWNVNATPPSLPITEIAPIYFLLLLCIALTFAAGFIYPHLDLMSAQLQNPQSYIESILRHSQTIGANQ